MTSVAISDIIVFCKTDTRLHAHIWSANRSNVWFKYILFEVLSRIKKVVSKIDGNRCKQTLASLSCFGHTGTVVPTKSDSDEILCQNTYGYTSIELTRIDRSRVY